MGNLYTRIVRINNPIIQVLSELKNYWRSKPRDYKKIRELQLKLHKLELKKEADKPKRLIGALERGYLKRVATRGET